MVYTTAGITWSTLKKPLHWFWAWKYDSINILIGIEPFCEGSLNFKTIFHAHTESKGESTKNTRASKLQDKTFYVVDKSSYSTHLDEYSIDRYCIVAAVS